MATTTIPHLTLRKGFVAGLLLALAFTIASAPALAKMQKGARQLDEALYDYSGSIRWSEFEKAYDHMDPELRSKFPLTDLDKARYKQVEVTRYDVRAQSPSADGIDREVQIDLINRHTQEARSLTYHEHWRYDAKSKMWWLTTGLPDITSGMEMETAAAN